MMRFYSAALVLRQTIYGGRLLLAIALVIATASRPCLEVHM